METEIMGLPIILWIAIVVVFSSIIVSAIKISRKKVSMAVNMDSKVSKRIAELMEEKSQFNDFKKNNEIRDVLREEGFSEDEIQDGFNERGVLIGKNFAYSPLNLWPLALLLLIYLSSYIGNMFAKVLFIIMVTGLGIYAYEKRKK